MSCYHSLLGGDDAVILFSQCTSLTVTTMMIVGSGASSLQLEYRTSVLIPRHDRLRQAMLNNKSFFDLWGMWCCSYEAISSYREAVGRRISILAVVVVVV